VYTRISRDSTGEGAGVGRQEEDCRAKAESNGWTVARVYSDNDVSAYSGTPRPGYRQLLQDIKAGELDAVLVWHVDRLYRRTAELEEYISVCQPRSVPTLTVESGPLDLTTPSGRMVARTLGSVAQYESEQKAERQRRANRQRAELGKHFGTRRPFGFELDGVTVRADEAAVVRDAFVGLLAGKSLAAIARDWNSRGFKTPQAGNPWTPTVLCRTLKTERLAGLKTYRGQVVRDAAGQPVTAQWPALVELDVWEAAQAILCAPERRWPSASRLLLSGVARCAVCDAPIQSGGTRNGRNRYRCARMGGHTYREAAPIDKYISDIVIARLASQDAADLLTSPEVDLGEVRREIAAIHVRRDTIAAGYAEGVVSFSQFKTANAKLAVRQAALEAKLPTAPAAALADLAAAPDPRQVWGSLDDDARRQVIDALMIVRIAPARTKEHAYLNWRARVANPETLQIEWKTS
jgi:DNA invertase Pin-like site-specific DNA recombinase